MSKSYLKGKTILIISSEKWNDLRLSKHHYAEELAARGNEVFFLNPPESIYRRPVITREINERLKVIDFNTHVKGERFIPLRLLNIVRRIQAQKIQKSFKKKIDIVWSFFPNQFHDLHVFNATQYIFHPVDRILQEKYRKTASHADIVFSVAQLLLNDFDKYNNNRYFVNHGLSRLYEKKLKPYQVHQQLKVGYVGNLLRPDIDHFNFIKIIQHHPNIQFHIWGSYEYKQLDWSHSGEKSVIDFIEALKSFHNVELKGLTHPEIVATETEDMDLFLCCYDPLREINRASNNHKLMEYFSSGKVVVSHHVETYVGKEELLVMCKNYDNQILPTLFEKVIANISYWNSEDKMKMRHEFAMNNTYANQIERIEELLVNI